MLRGSYLSTVSFKGHIIYVNTLCVHNIKCVLHGPGLLEKLLHIGPCKLIEFVEAVLEFC